MGLDGPALCYVNNVFLLMLKVSAHTGSPKSPLCGLQEAPASWRKGELRNDMRVIRSGLLSMSEANEDAGERKSRVASTRVVMPDRSQRVQRTMTKEG